MMLHRFWIAPALWRLGVIILILLHSAQVDGNARQPFQFASDTFNYSNELYWEYRPDPATGKMVTERRHPRPTYGLHCFVVARSARQFYFHARFAPEEPKATSASYRHLIRSVMGRSAQFPSSDEPPIVFPGYADLKEFSRDHEALLKAECGGAWQSYVQRGNWRMVFPFTRGGQEQVAHTLQKKLAQERPLLVHVVCFPSLTLNHALLLFDCHEAGAQLEFLAYDPNQPQRPARLFYDGPSRSFQFPPNNYFAGGRVNVYEIYRGLLF
jgi:hypothetical protein